MVATRKRVVKLLISGLFISLLFSSLSCKTVTKQVEKAAKKVKKVTYKDRLAKRLDDPPSVFAASNDGSGHLVIVDSQTDEKQTSIPVEGKVYNVAMRPNGSELYATSYENNKIFIVDLKENKVVKTLESKDEPLAIAFHPDGTKAYVTHIASNYISVIDTDKKEIETTIEVEKQPATLAISFDGKRAYVGHSMRMEGMETQTIYGMSVKMPKFVEGSKNIVVVDLEKNEKAASIPSKGNCSGVAVNPDDSIVYATTSSIDVAGMMAGKSMEGLKDAIAVIDTSENKVIKEIEFELGSGPKAIAFTPDGKKAYAVCGAKDDATAINADKHEIITRIPLGLGG